MSDKDFDAFFREKFESYEAEPLDAVWGRISSELSGPAKRRVFSPVWMAAASVMIVAGAGLWLTRPSKTIQLKAREEVKTAVNIKKEDSSLPVAREQPKAGFLRKLAELKVANKSQRENRNEQQALFTETGDTTNEGLASEVSNKDLTKVEPERLVHVTPSPVSAARLQIPDTSKPVLALAGDDMKMNHQDDAERSRPGIKTVGDLVNFVVAKVDKRKDKLIEFSDNEEGTLISGINLGVLKIKAKNEDKRY